MNIYINGLSIAKNAGGQAVYGLQLARALVRGQQGCRFTIFCQHTALPLWQQALAGEEVTLSPVTMRAGASAIARIAADQFVVPWRLRGKRDGVLLTLSNVASVLTRLPQVVVVQTVFAIKSERDKVKPKPSLTRLQRLYFNWMMPWTARASTKLVAVSPYLERVLKATFPKAKDKILCICEGVDTAHMQAATRAMKPAEPRTQTILFVGTMFPYKNVDQLIKALGLLTVSMHDERHLELVLVGRDPDGTQQRRLTELAQHRHVVDRVTFVGGVMHAEVAAYYQRADLFVFPSEAESFGLPILEAMSHGLPVITVRKTAMADVGGDAARYARSSDAADLADAMAQVLYDDDLRENMIRAGRVRAASMTWDHTTRDMASLLMAVAGAKG